MLTCDYRDDETRIAVSNNTDQNDDIALDGRQKV
jgi:hypothetical protein